MSHQLEELAEGIVFAHDADSIPSVPTSTEAAEFERVAALYAAATTPIEEPPELLMTRLAADALKFCAEQDQDQDQDQDQVSQDRSAPIGGSGSNSGSASISSVTHTSEAPGFTTPRERSTGSGIVGSLLTFTLGAAAAGLALWFGLKPAAPTPLGELRMAVLDAEPNVQVQWSKGPSELSGSVRGDVVWSQARQDGWLTFRDLPVLPADKAYQLWIVDGSRTGDPVDGGVFRIEDAGQETIIDIDPKLPIGKAAAFVITVEDREGVVVSKQEHVVAIAKP